MFNKSLCIFDIESTGLSPSKDRIVQLGIKIISPIGDILLNKSKLYNPEIPISEEAKKTHGITDEDVKNSPLFKDDAKKLKKLFENKIIVGYNIIKFDLPMLSCEFERAGIAFNVGKDIIDVLNIEKKVNTRDLSTVYQRYTGNKLKGSHDALIDLTATFEILKCQMKTFDLDENKVLELSGAKNTVDYSGKLTLDKEGYLIFTFGKCKDKRVIENVDYVNWMLDGDFPDGVKKLLKEEINKHTIKKGPGKPMTFPKTPIKPQTITLFPGANVVDDDIPF